MSKVMFSECLSDPQREGHPRTLNTWDLRFRPMVTSMVLTEADATWQALHQLKLAM